MAHTTTPFADAEVAPTEIQTIGFADVIDSLRLGLADFWAQPSHYVAAALIYPLVMVILAIWVAGQNVLPLLFPLAAGFALMGPLVAVFFYEISRRRELGLDTSWSHGMEVLRSPALPGLIGLGAFLCLVFVAWVGTAQMLYQGQYGLAAPMSASVFFTDVLTTSRGWTLIALGNLLGLVFALTVLCTTVVAFPMVLDRHGGAYEAIATSLRAVRRNPLPMLFWGLIVAVLVALASIPLFVGLVVILPVLGHATWHLYRKLVPVSS